MNKKKLVPLALASFCLLAIPGWIRAEEPDPAAGEEAAAEPPWDASVGLSYLATSGNSDSQTAGLDLEAIRRPMPWGVEFKAQVHRAEEDGEATAERYLVGLRGTRSLSERWDAFVGLSAEQDEFASIDLRGIVEVGAVYKALLGPRHLLELDFAVTWTDEDRLPPEIDDSHLGALVAASYELAISDNATFSQDFHYHPNFDDSGDWRVDSLTALTAALNQHLALKLSHEIRYRNEPIDGNDDTDTTTRASLVLNL